MASDWNRLAARTEANTVFFRHEWFDAAWCWWKNQGSLSVVSVTRDGELIGICPLMLRRTKMSYVPVILLEFLAVPDTQECALLAALEDLDEVVSALIHSLSTKEIRWDIALLSKIRADSPALQKLKLGLGSISCGVHVADGGVNLGLSLEDDWQSYYSRRTRRLKKGNNLIVNRLKRDEKQVEVLCYGRATKNYFDKASLMRTLVDLSASSWKAKSGFTLEKVDPGNFIDRLSDHAIRNSWFLTWILTIDGVPAAMEYQLEYNGVISGLRADYDPQFERYSPGTLLNRRIIEQLFDSEARLYFMGPGSNDYKMRWSEKEIQLNNLVAYGLSAAGRTVCCIELYLRPFAKRILGLKVLGRFIRR